MEDVEDQEIGDLLMIVVDIPREELAKVQTISIYALSRTDASQTLPVVDFMKKLPISILIDGGNTHNFISEHIKKRLGLSVVDVTSFSVGSVDGNQMTSAGTCQLSLIM